MADFGKWPGNFLDLVQVLDGRYLNLAWLACVDCLYYIPEMLDL